MQLKRCCGVGVFVLLCIWGYFMLLENNEQTDVLLEYNEKTDVHLKAVMANENEDYIVSTEGCQIARIDPLHYTIKHLFKRLPDLNCSSHSFVIVENNTIRLNVSDSNDVKCTLQDIFRSSDFSSEFKNAIQLDKNETVTPSEFVKVECTSPEDYTLQFYPFVRPKESVEERIATYRKKHELLQNHQFRIVMLGLDSTSKSQFLRHMTRTHEFMKQKLTYAELHGYNKLGKNTYPNIVPMLCGKLESEVVDTSHHFVDELPIIWKQFMKQGYRTLYNEDAPMITGFNYARMGFKVPPTDYYLRPWSLAVESEIWKWKLGCLNDRTETEVVLNYLEDFLALFPSDPLLSFTFITRQSHDRFNGLSYLDKPIRDFLERLHTRGHFNNTIMFFFGDHGFRYGSIRSTYIGRMEGKLPFMFIVVPPWFPNQYPQMFKNLKINERRLTTPLDIYATLNNLRNFTGEGFDTEGKGRSISLLSEQVPANRTCEDIPIPTQWCSCVRSEPIPVDDYRVKASAEKIVKKLNLITEKHRTMCAELSLVSILSAYKQDIELGDDEQETENEVINNFLVSVKVTPSDGIFEGSVWFSTTNSYSVDKTIERINIYGNQSACVDENFLKPYCYCVKNQVSTS